MPLHRRGRGRPPRRRLRPDRRQGPRLRRGIRCPLLHQLPRHVRERLRDRYRGRDHAVGDAPGTRAGNVGAVLQARDHGKARLHAPRSPGGRVRGGGPLGPAHLPGVPEPLQPGGRQGQAGPGRGRVGPHPAGLGAPALVPPATLLRHGALARHLLPRRRRRLQPGHPPRGPAAPSLRRITVRQRGNGHLGRRHPRRGTRWWPP